MLGSSPGTGPPGDPVDRTGLQAEPTGKEDLLSRDTSVRPRLKFESGETSRAPESRIAMLISFSLPWYGTMSMCPDWAVLHFSEPF